MNCLALAERLRQAISACPPLLTHGAGAISCSFGVGWADANEPVTVDGLLRDADSALYLAKRKGRNRVESLEASFGVVTDVNCALAARVSVSHS